jgi:hypothetical protein
MKRENKYYRRGRAGGMGDGNYICYHERKRGHWSDGSTYRKRTSEAKGKTMNGQEGGMSGNEKGEQDGQGTVLPITY